MRKQGTKNEAKTDLFSLAIPASKAIADGYQALHNAAQLMARGLPEVASQVAKAKALCNLPSRAGYPYVPKQARTIAKSLLALPSVDRLAKVPLVKAVEEMEGMTEFSKGFLKRSSPPQVIKACYEALSCKGRSEQKISTVDIYLLALIGYGVHGLYRMSGCAFCPRFSTFGTPFCREHSQSKLALGTAAEKSARYRTGKAIAQHYNYYFAVNPDYVRLTERTIPAYTSRLLWRTPLPDEERSIRAIKKTVAESPQLIALIGSDFGSLPSSKVYQRLAERVDPDEVRPRVWKWKLERLKLWYAYRNSLTAWKTNALPRYWKMLGDAKRMEKLGFSKSRIAEILEISPSTISSWLKKSGAKTLCEAFDYHLKHMPRRTPLTPSGLRR